MPLTNPNNSETTPVRPNVAKPNTKPSPKTGSSRSGFSPSGRPLSRRDDEPGPLSMTGIRTGLLNSLMIKIGMGLLIAIFAAGFAMSSLGPVGNTGDDTSSRVMGGGPDPVARVGDEPIRRDLFQRSLAQQIQMMEQFGQSPGPAEMLRYRQSTLEQMAGQAAQFVEAKRQNISASDAEIDAKIDEFVGDTLKPQAGQTEAAIRRRIEAKAGSIEAYKTEQRKNYDRDLVARQIIIEKLEKKIKDENKVSEDDYKRSMTKLNLRVIKVSPKPIPPAAKDVKAAQSAAETAAKTRAEKLASQLQNATPAAFATAAKTNSDDIATKAKGGLVGAKMPAELPYAPVIRDALVNSKSKIVGPLTSDDVSKDQYIFFIENRKLELPKDYAKKSKEYLKTFEESKDNEALSKWQEELKKTHQPEVLDPTLVAYGIQDKQLLAAQGDERTRLLNEAIDKYNEALQYASSSETSAIQYQLSQLYAEAKQPEKRLAALKIASENRDAKQAKIEYARALRDAGNKDEAIKQLGELSKQITETPAAPSMMMMGGGGSGDEAMRFQIASEYEQLGKADLAKAERARIKPPTPQPGMPGGMNLGGANLGGAGGSTIDLGNVSTGGKKTITIPASKPRAATPSQAPKAPTAR